MIKKLLMLRTRELMLLVISFKKRHAILDMHLHLIDIEAANISNKSDFLLKNDPQIIRRFRVIALILQAYTKERCK